MAEFANYQAPQQQASSGGVGSLWWTLQKGSMLMTFTNENVWKGVEAGRGFAWNGIVGFRGLARGKFGVAGAEAMGNSRWGQSLSPHRLASWIAKKTGWKGAVDFAEFGLFGKSKPGGIGDVLGRVIGGGPFGQIKSVDERVNERLTTKAAKQKSRLRVLRESQKQKKIFLKKVRAGIGSFEGSEVSWADKMSENLTESQKAQIKEIALKKEAKVQARTTKLIKPAIEKDVASKLKVARGIATAGRLFGRGMGAMLAYDIGKFLVSTTANAAGGISDSIEAKLRTISNRNSEFGGNVGIGFYSGNSATERQRALSAAGRGGYVPAMGNEAGMQHVDSTW